MAARLPFQVRAYPGNTLGRFRHYDTAQRVAQMWSERWGSWAEVDDTRNGGSLIGQYDKGALTPEFAHLRGTIAGLERAVAA